MKDVHSVLDIHIHCLRVRYSDRPAWDHTFLIGWIAGVNPNGSPRSTVLVHYVFSCCTCIFLQWISICTYRCLEPLRKLDSYLELSYSLLFSRSVQIISIISCCNNCIPRTNEKLFQFRYYNTDTIGYLSVYLFDRRSWSASGVMFFSRWSSPEGSHSTKSYQ